MNDLNQDPTETFEPSILSYVVGTVVGIAIFISVAQFKGDSSPFFAALSFGVVYMIVGLTWPYRRRWILWFLIILVAMIHIAALVWIRFPTRISYGIAFTPLVAIDVFICYRAIMAVLRMTRDVDRR